MTKSDFIQMLKNIGGYASTAEATRAYDQFVASMETAILANKELAITGFGNFKIVSRKARKGRNPQTGETIEIAASKSVKFSPAKKLKDQL